MADEFKAGDLVQVKSGGERMTVENVGDMYGQPMVHCVWFEGKRVVRDSFRPEALMIAAASTIGVRISRG